jgi:hypothetical protein
MMTGTADCTRYGRFAGNEHQPADRRPAGRLAAATGDVRMNES